MSDNNGIRESVLLSPLTVRAKEAGGNWESSHLQDSSLEGNTQQNGVRDCGLGTRTWMIFFSFLSLTRFL